MKNNRIPFYLFSCLTIFLLLLGWMGMHTYFYGRWPTTQTLGLAFGIAGFMFFSLSLFFKSRWKKLEDWIGGLDQIYSLHHEFGKIAFILLCIHPFLMAIKWLPHRIDKFLLFIFPYHHRVEINFGSIALWIMIVVLGITFVQIFSYQRWKKVHRFMMLAYFFAVLHFVLIEKRFARGYDAALLLYFSLGIGAFGIFFKQIYLPQQKWPRYEVIKTNKITDNVIEITAQAIEKPISYIPGQYAFFTFENLSDEAHPFTLCPYPEKNTLSILVKVRGDFTKTLYQKIRPGAQMSLEGPYGRFDYKKAKSGQIWIAGGVGIVPFLNWAREMAETHSKQKEIDLFFCIHRKKDSIFFKEFEQISRRLPHFRCHLFCSEEKNRLDINKLLKLCPQAAKKQVLMCGPKRLTKDMMKQLRSIGVKRKDIFFEDFAFF